MPGRSGRLAGPSSRRRQGGPSWWADATGSVPTASFTVAKLRWLAEHEPGNAARIARVLLPHDWLTRRLGAAEPVTDRGDASETGYFATAKGQWLPELAAAALGHELALPRVAAPGEAVGQTGDGALLGSGTGDNMAAALGLGLEPGQVAVSVGTSGTAFAVAAVPAADPSSAVAGFADATGHFLPLVCTVNAGLVLSAAAARTGTDLAGLDQRALAARPGADGVTLVPYFDGERTPNLPRATGIMSGLTKRNATADNLARVTGRPPGHGRRRSGIPARRSQASETEVLRRAARRRVVVGRRRARRVMTLTLWTS
ncbi:MAG: FGGY family carbohydrate kinase [Streptosporangiaceae bacterium]